MDIAELIAAGSASVRSVAHYMAYMERAPLDECDPFHTAKIFLLNTLADVLDAQTAVVAMKAGLFQPAADTKSQELVIAARDIVNAFEHQVEAGQRFLFAAAQVLECAEREVDQQPGDAVQAQFVRLTELAKNSIASINRTSYEQLLTEFAGMNIVE